MTAMMKDGSAVASGETIATAPIAPFANLTDMAFGNIRRVYEALTPNRETLAVLFSLDAAQTDPTEQWITFFVETAAAQLIWDERPTGTVSHADGAWVLARFDEAPTLSVLAILARIIEEAHTIPPGFAADVRQRAALFGSLAGPAMTPKPASHLRLVA